MKIPFWPNPQNSGFIDLNLSRIEELLKRLNNPHLKLPPTIHFAGTNGKGSTLSFVKSILQESGLKTHCYTSPHLVDFNERIILANKEISDEVLNAVLRECQKACEQEPAINITYFEGITAAAFLAFSQVKADILLLETGLGGRFDATNILNEALCSVITPISIDHEEFLGNNIERIAFEKAGILKQNCPLIIGNQSDEALKVLIQEAENKNCKTYIYNKDFNKDLVNLDKLPLEGNHQFENAAVAIKTCELIQKELRLANLKIEDGLRNTFWPARLQKITSGKFFNILPDNCQLYLDGGHNLQCAQTLRDFLERKNDSKKILIFSMMKDKDLKGFLSEISSEIDQLIAFEVSSEARSLKAGNIFDIAQKLNIDSEKGESFGKIFDKLKLGDQKTTILICGSLYLAGEFLTENKSA